MKLPGGRLSSRPLHIIFAVDVSGSMGGDKIQQLNNAIRDAIPFLLTASEENTNAEVLIRAITFSTGAQWHVATPVPVQQFSWTDLIANGSTDMGKALKMIAEQLKVPPMSQRAFPPVLVLVSDGQPTDDFEAGLKALLAEPWGQAAVRVAVAIGRDADKKVLERFVANPELPVLEAHNAEELHRHIRWVSTEPVRIASRASAFLPSNPPPDTKASGDVW